MITILCLITEYYYQPLFLMYFDLLYFPFYLLQLVIFLPYD